MFKRPKRDEPMMGVEMTPCFELNGVTYVPHYRNGCNGVYVGPGFWEIADPTRSNHTPPSYGYNSKKYTDYELTQMGAKAKTHPLWPRKKK
jgi:hypothetical protein